LRSCKKLCAAAPLREIVNLDLGGLSGFSGNRFRFKQELRSCKKLCAAAPLREIV
jgi:hypothetical protein